jgi:hypothetical protein
LGGITAYHFRLLCENPWQGGGGYTPEDVGNMTLDQIWFRLCDKGILKNKIGDRVMKRESAGGLRTAKARTKDGQLITLKSTGKSKAQMIKENQEKEKSKRSNRKNRRRGRNRNGS